MPFWREDTQEEKERKEFKKEVKKVKKDSFLSLFKKTKNDDMLKEKDVKIDEKEQLSKLERLLRLKEDFNTKELVAVKYEFISSSDDGEGFGPMCYKNHIYYIALKIDEKNVYDILTENIIEVESNYMYFDVPFVIEQKPLEDFPSISMFLKNETLNKWRILEIYNTINKKVLSFFQIENDIEMNEDKTFVVTQNYCDGEIKAIIGYTTNDKEVEDFVKEENKSLTKGENYSYCYELIENIDEI